MTTGHELRSVAIGLVAAVSASPATPASATLAGGPVGWQLTGIEYVESVSPSDTSDRKTAEVDCSGSKYVISGGFSIGGGSGNVLIEDVVPFAHSVRVTANEDEDGSPTAWSLTARAVCANRPAGWEIRSDVDSNSPDYASAVAQCSAGKVAIGVALLCRTPTALHHGHMDRVGQR